MQTFLPCPRFDETARVLDTKRLGKQRVEAIQVVRALTVPGYGWRHHPAAAMWAGYEEALVRYGLDICAAWCLLGHADTCATTMVTDLTQNAFANLGWDDIKSVLVRKDPGHYRTFFPDVPDDLEYVWPGSDRPRRVAI